MSDSEPKIIATDQALRLAEEQGLDLVEITPNQEPPIVKIMDYSKFRFEQIKRNKDAKKKQHIVHIKEVKVRPRIDDHDYDHKVRHARTFLEKGDKVKFTMMFRGREIVHAELGSVVLKQIQEDLVDCAVVEKPSSIEGRNMSMILAPLASKAKVTTSDSHVEGSNG